jgi:hypothetical protein
MLTAAAVIHVVSARQKRRLPRNHGLPLVGVALTLALIVVGILAIGRPIV